MPCNYHSGALLNADVGQIQAQINTPGNESAKTSNNDLGSSFMSAPFSNINED